MEQLVLYLDKAAVPTATSFQVLKIDRGIDGESLKKKLVEMLKPAAPKGEVKPEQPNQQGQRRGGRGGRGGNNQGSNDNGGGGNE
jgi:hypothetical protein